MGGLAYSRHRIVETNFLKCANGPYTNITIFWQHRCLLFDWAITPTRAGKRLVHGISPCAGRVNQRSILVIMVVYLRVHHV